MKTKILFSSLVSGLLFAGVAMMSSCTDSFEGRNINPNEVTPEEMEQDNLKTGALFAQMERGVFIVGKDKGGTYQVHQMLNGDNFAGYFANIKDSYNIGNRHHDHYAMVSHWYNMPFNDTYPEIMQPWKSICDVTEPGSMDRALATVVKVFGMHRITDKYGPIPYSHFGEEINLPYDSQQEVYNKFFTELDEAIQTMETYLGMTQSPYLARYDYVYNGNINKWIKFANTLRLRLAMRISYVDQAKAVEEATKAINNTYGLMRSADDDAVLHQTSTLSFTNPIWEVTQSFNDMRMSATMDCYLTGYADPRMKAYFIPAENTGEYHGMRNGMTSGFASMGGTTSAANFNNDSDLPWMRAAEAYFLLAEAKLRLGLGDRDVKDLYEDGIRTSFASNACQNVDSYIADANNVPTQRWTNPANNQGVDVSSMVSNLPVAWDDSANNETKLERIMVQKWIALYPDGQEAWSEMRRTGYPGWVRIASYSYASGVSSNQLISRIQFPSTEFDNNAANVQAAVQLLGGTDNAGTRLWWDVKR